MLTFVVASSSASARPRDEALLKVRGATAAQVLKLSGCEAAVVGVAGVFFGCLLAWGASLILFRTNLFSVEGLWVLAPASLMGLVISAVAVLLPAFRRSRGSTAVAAALSVGARHSPLWARVYLDYLLLALAAVAFWRSASTGYQVVLAPEGVTATSVDYTAFLSPVLLWVGFGLLTIRIGRFGLSRGKGVLAVVLAPLARALSVVVATTFARQNRRLTIGIGLTALAFSFATSTAIFDRTYQAQARVDAELTNGSDVTVTGTASAPASDQLQELRTLPGVVAAASMQHRYAYVGTDLQDLYGIDAAAIGQATSMSDAYFAGGDARATLSELARTPDGVLVSHETVNDYRLSPGEVINLRLLNVSDHQYRSVPFRLVGIAREFPTAPKDSFLVANASYVAQQTGSAAGEVVLLRVGGDAAMVAQHAVRVMSNSHGAIVSDIGQTARLIGSSIAAIDVSGLTRLELGFALVMVAASAGLVLALGFADRQRAFAILAALGANPRQLGAFVWSEAALVLAGGIVLGLPAGWAVSSVLVRLLTGVFDPPPEGLSVPWAYLVVLVVVAGAGVAMAAANALRSAGEDVTKRLRG